MDYQLASLVLRKGIFYLAQTISLAKRQISHLNIYLTSNCDQLHLGGLSGL